MQYSPLSQAVQVPLAGTLIPLVVLYVNDIVLIPESSEVLQSTLGKQW